MCVYTNVDVCFYILHAYTNKNINWLTDLLRGTPQKKHSIFKDIVQI